MADIISFGDIANLQATIRAQVVEISDLRLKVHTMQTALNATAGINDILKLQLNDILVTIEAWRAGLDGIAANVIEMKSKLPD